MDEINVIEAYEYLKNKSIVVCVSNNKKTYFKIVDDAIKVNNGNAFYSISIEEFMSFYKENSFYVLEDNAFEVSKEKDEEYYNFKHK